MQEKKKTPQTWLENNTHSFVKTVVVSHDPTDSILEGEEAVFLQYLIQDLSHLSSYFCDLLTLDSFSHTYQNKVGAALIYKQNGYICSATMTDLPIPTIAKSAPFSLYFPYHFPHAYSYASVHGMITLYLPFYRASENISSYSVSTVKMKCKSFA